jgi:hypothetical protein
MTTEKITPNATSIDAEFFTPAHYFTFFVDQRYQKMVTNLRRVAGSLAQEIETVIASSGTELCQKKMVALLALQNLADEKIVLPIFSKMDIAGKQVFSSVKGVSFDVSGVLQAAGTAHAAFKLGAYNEEISDLVAFVGDIGNNEQKQVVSIKLHDFIEQMAEFKDVWLRQGPRQMAKTAEYVRSTFSRALEAIGSIIESVMPFPHQADATRALVPARIRRPEVR